MIGGFWKVGSTLLDLELINVCANMAACFDLLLRVFYGFLLLLFHLYVPSRHEIVPNDLNHGLEVSSGRLDHSKSNDFKFLLLDVRYRFKRELAERNFKLSLPISKATKHGQTTLALPHSMFFMDLTTCMDIHCNPGPDFENPCLNWPALRCEELNVPANRPNYSRMQLLGLRSKSTLQPDLYKFLKTL